MSSDAEDYGMSQLQDGSGDLRSDVEPDEIYAVRTISAITLSFLNHHRLLSTCKANVKRCGTS
jgi:hypothetical protein